MSFQFPANPADGDIIIQPQPDGQFIKGTYNSSSNTWAVGELPEEPGVPGPEGPKGDQGDKGNPGKGVAVSGVVETESALPTPNDATLQFYIVDDTNTLYYSDGFEWTNLGSPIQGPQGETGVDGTDGTNGINGFDGKGWTGTTIIDETDQDPPNYQINFNSNDGLGFVTDNLIGPQGEVGNIPLATATRLGGIKIGRGLNIKPDGTASAGETNVDLETVPLTPEGTIYAPTTYYLSYIPGYFNAGDNGNFSSSAYASGPTATQAGNVVVPELSDGAIIYFFTGSDVNSYFTAPGGYGLQWTVFARLVSTLSLGGGASFVNGGASLAQQMVHNYSIGTEARRTSNQSSFKVGQATWAPGLTSLPLTVSTQCQAAQRANVAFGRCRIIVVPYRSKDVFDNEPDLLAAHQIPSRALYDSADPFDDDWEPLTPEEINAQNASNLRWELNTQLEAIDAATSQAYTSGSIYELLRSTRQEMLDLQNLPGSYDQVNGEFDRLSAIVKPYTSLTFRFE